LAAIDSRRVDNQKDEDPMDWKPYDPTWLVEWVRANRPDLPWLADALAKCTHAASDGRAYLYFVDPSDAGEPGSAWVLDETLRLDSTPRGTLMLDILQDRRVGGIEFLARL
jgi:hypothetical protein